MTDPAPIVRRDDLDAALHEIESGTLTGTCIVFGRGWWDKLPDAQRRAFRKRARRAHVSLRSDSKIGSHFVEVRGYTRSDAGLSSEQPESPRRR